MIVTLYILAVLVGLLVVSSAVPRFHEWDRRLPRVCEFEPQHQAWVEAGENVPDYDDTRFMNPPHNAIDGDDKARGASRVPPFVVGGPPERNAARR